MAEILFTTGDSLPDRTVVSGGRIEGSERPAYSHHRPQKMSIPVVIAVPHAGRDYPAAVLGEMREPDYATLRLEDRYVDALATQVAAQTGASLLVAHAPRAMLDLNRAQDDVDWGMVRGAGRFTTRHSQANRRARSGLGLVPRRLPGSGEIWRSKLDVEELDARIDGIHRPYHSALAMEMESIRDEWGVALLVDFHSMPPLRRRYGQQKPAQFVLGDRFGASCDGGLVAQAFRYLDRNDRPSGHNRPYSGGFVLDRHSAPRRGLHAIQLEVCRSTYLDGDLTQPSARMPSIAKLLSGMVREMGAAAAQLPDRGRFAQAAE